MANYNYGPTRRQPIVIETYQPFQPDLGQVGRPIPFQQIADQWSPRQRYPYAPVFASPPVVSEGQLVDFNGVPLTRATGPYPGPATYVRNNIANDYQYGERNPSNINVFDRFPGNARGRYPALSPCGPADIKREIYPRSAVIVPPPPGWQQLPGISPNIYPELNLRAPNGVPSYYSEPRLRQRNLAYDTGLSQSPIVYPTTHSIPGPYLQSYMNLPGRRYPY